jgi:hypothetical protein
MEPKQIDPHKKILIVSDNPRLSKCFIEELAEQCQARAGGFDLCYSKWNKSPELMRQLGAKSIDLRELSDKEDIKSKYDIAFSLH